MKFLVMPGDGIGPEIVPVAVAALRSLNQKLGLGINSLNSEDLITKLKEEFLFNKFGI